MALLLAAASPTAFTGRACIGATCLPLDDPTLGLAPPHQRPSCPSSPPALARFSDLKKTSNPLKRSTCKALLGTKPPVQCTYETRTYHGPCLMPPGASMPNKASDEAGRACTGSLDATVRVWPRLTTAQTD